ncbi:hypothetical protein OBBRIDRAFT_835915 [Obba rivulosa]|uniref:Uncharacterized protein n=1 Tax=Obba rivulosa TaxID=1052685 RepID=A0A8E2DN97_9APHY|nr:hypothetical protein OBBRIDRAFT_835915 [Obba rivulosa]
MLLKTYKRGQGTYIAEEDDSTFADAADKQSRERNVAAPHPRSEQIAAFEARKAICPCRGSPAERGRLVPECLSEARPACDAGDGRKWKVKHTDGQSGRGGPGPRTEASWRLAADVSVCGNPARGLLSAMVPWQRGRAWMRRCPPLRAASSASWAATESSAWQTAAEGAAAVSLGAGTTQ